MAAKFDTIPAGTKVTWHYRGAIGHGTVTGVHKLGTSAADTEYSISEHDHHVSDTGSHEKATVYHYGRALTRVAASIAQLELAAAHLSASAGEALHPAATEQLMEYWAHGEGSAKIRWGVDGDFDRCVVQLGKHVRPDEVKGLCSNLHQRATGFRPGHAPGESHAK